MGRGSIRSGNSPHGLRSLSGTRGVHTEFQIELCFSLRGTSTKALSECQAGALFYFASRGVSVRNGLFRFEYVRGDHLTISRCARDWRQPLQPLPGDAHTEETLRRGWQLPGELAFR